MKPTTGSDATARRRIFQQLEPSAWPGAGLSPVNTFLVAVILVATLVMIIETEPAVNETHAVLLDFCGWVFGLIFMVEYATRIWAAAERANDGGGWSARLRFILSPWGLVDLFVVVATVAPLIDPNITALRLVRLGRIVLMGKLGHMTDALSDFGMVIRSRRYELAITLGLCLSVMLFGATVMWLTEGGTQPEQFGSIPRALWWAVVTLTTIGYGDAYPVTALGRLFSAIFSLAGIGLIALPSGILASAFSELAQRRRETRGRE